MITETASGQIIVSDRKKWNAIIIFFFFCAFTSFHKRKNWRINEAFCSLPETVLIKIFFETLQHYLYYPECYINSSSSLHTTISIYIDIQRERKKNKHFHVENLYIYICIYNFRLPFPRDPRRNTRNSCHVTRALFLSSFNERNRLCYASSDMFDRDVTIFPFFCGDSFKG